MNPEVVPPDHESDIANIFSHIFLFGIEKPETPTLEATHKIVKSVSKILEKLQKTGHLIVRYDWDILLKKPNNIDLPFMATDIAGEGKFNTPKINIFLNQRRIEDKPHIQRTCIEILPNFKAESAFNCIILEGISLVIIWDDGVAQAGVGTEGATRPLTPEEIELLADKLEAVSRRLILNSK